MPGKNTYRIGSAGDANYPTLAAIPSEILAQGDSTFLVYPGTYTALTSAVLADAAFVGLGDREEIVVNGAFTIANTSTGTTLFENMTFVGTNATAGSGSVCISKLGAASAPIHLRNVTLSNADFGISHSAELSFATTTRQLTVDYVDATGVDKAIRANANVAINFSALNTSSNAYITPGGGAGTIAVTVRASTSGGSNTGASTETVLALIS